MKNLDLINRHAENKAIRRNNTAVRIIQGLCLALILIIYYTVAVHAPNNINYDSIRVYTSESFLVMMCMLLTITVVLEFCKEFEYNT